MQSFSVRAPITVHGKTEEAHMNQSRHRAMSLVSQTCNIRSRRKRFQWERLKYATPQVVIGSSRTHYYFVRDCQTQKKIKQQSANQNRRPN